MSLDKALQEIMEFYSSQGMARELGFGANPALLIIDFQKGLSDETRPAGCNLDSEIENTAVLLQKARDKAIPIFFFVISYKDPSIEGGRMAQKLPALANFTEESDNVEIDSRLTPQPNEQVITKKYFSCFYGTHLDASLRVLQVDTLIITGCITSGCIRASATDSITYGFRPIIPRECVGDRAQIPHEVNLMDIHARCGDVLPLQRVLDYLDSL